jgi:tetratricopeptide (TPR) repeat protein
MLATAPSELPARRSRRRGPRPTWFNRRRTVTILAVCVAAACWALWPSLRYNYRIAQAQKLLAAADAEKALVVLGREEGLHPDSADLVYLLGVAHRRANHLQKSGEYFRRAAVLGCPRSQLLPQQAMAAFQAGDPAAEAELKALLRQSLDNETAEEVYEALAKGYFGKFWLNQAMICLNHWIDWQPRKAGPRHLRAMIFGLSGDVEQQMVDFRAILEVNPNDAAAHGLLADALSKTNNVDEALVHYTWCREHVPGDNLAALGMAVCMRRKGNYDAAKQLLAEVVSSGPTGGIRGRLLSELGELNLELGNPKAALDYLREAVELLPYDGSAHYSYAMALSKTGKSDEAKAIFKRGEELEQRQLRLHDLERELANNPGDADLRYEAAMLIKEQGLNDEAITLLLTAIKLDPIHRKAHAALADCYERQGKDDLAEVHREMAADGAVNLPSQPLVVMPQRS